MFFTLGHLWSSLTRSSRNARWFYLVLTVAFVVIGAAGAIKGDPLVTILGATVGAVTAGLAAVAPKLASWTTVPKADELADDD
jgi:hypothetical protein